MSSYRDLIAWQRAMDLAQQTYSVTAAFPPDERYGLTTQMRRCATSIASNIAEGSGRISTRDWQHFLGMSHGSTCELETQILLAIRLGYGDIVKLKVLLGAAEEVGRIINGLLNSTSTRDGRKRLEPPSPDTRGSVHD